MVYKFLFGTITLMALSSLFAQHELRPLKGKNFNVITLEASLKPFKINEEAYIRNVAKEMFVQWSSLLRHADTVSIMLWTGDGSEILDYSGNMQQRLEWAMYMGNPNTPHPIGSGPKELSIHERAYLYIDNPPNFSYGDLKYIVKALKEEGRKVTGKTVIVGATFDPGPEFAKSPFKYQKHPEILGGNAMGHKTFVNCYSVLDGDKEHYAGFPNGIPVRTPFGTFFGRQSQCFLTDLGFDYIWFSNGFGFGAEGWSSTGAIFDGKNFQQDELPELSEKVLWFWKLFRVECPKFPIYTRGTNLSVGADLARDAVNIKAIYEGGFNMLPPPNSPWAALDGDFGLEMVGYMSRMAQLPDNRFLFRYYTHDPWWLNSPWLDRYGREAHDIYLPMAVSRIDELGNICVPTHLNFLTIDDTYGNMPTQVPDEVTPHILNARYDMPTAPGPLIWVYPFDEYHDWALNRRNSLSEVYYGDWFIRQAINNGVPLNTVVSTTIFQSVIVKEPDLFKESVLVTIIPDEGTSLEEQLIRFVKKGGKLIIFGPTNRASKSFLKFLNLKNDAELDGIFKLNIKNRLDKFNIEPPSNLNHRSLFNGGGIASVIQNPTEKYTQVIVQARQNSKNRDIVFTRQLPDWNGGKILYIRGTNSSNFTGGRLLTPDNPVDFFIGPTLLRYALNEFGISLAVDKQSPEVKSPVVTISRSDNSFIFSGYNPNSTVKQRFKFAQGAPLLVGLETILNSGYSSYSMPTSWNRMCRIFVEQDSGLISHKELHSGERGIVRRYEVKGLKSASVRVYAGLHVDQDKFHAYVNSGYPWKSGQHSFSLKNDEYGKYFLIENVTGSLVVSW